MAADSWSETQRAVDAALGGGDARAALQLMQGALGYPSRGVDDRVTYREAIRLLVRVPAPRIAEAARRASVDWADVSTLHALGDALLELGFARLAAAVLLRAHRLAPKEPALLTQLSAALETADLHADARRILEGATTLADTHFLIRYLLAFNTLMSADVEGARRLSVKLPTLLGHAETESTRFMVNALRDMLLRADALHTFRALDARDLQGWHFVTTGSILLSTAPRGRPDASQGRYGTAPHDPTHLRGVLMLLRGALSTLGQQPERVLLLEDPASRALGLAAARLLGVSAVSDQPESAPRGLVVAHDLALLPPRTAAALRPHAPGRIVFAHAASWTDEPPFSADFLGLLGRSSAPPAALGTPEARAEEIVQAVLDDELGWEDQRAELERWLPGALRAVGEARAGFLRTDGQRRRQRLDSPVKSPAASSRTPA